MGTVALRTAIVDTIKTALGSAALTVEGHGGRFDLQELLRVSAKAPAVYVAALAHSDFETSNGETRCTISWAAFVIAKDMPQQLTRDVVAAGIVDALGKIIPNNRWGLEDEAEQIPTNIRAQNMFSAEIDKKGVAMWGLSWQQQMVIAAATDSNTLDDLLLIHTETDLDPSQSDEPLAKDRITLEAPP